MNKEHDQFNAMPFAHDSNLNFIFLGQNYEIPLAMLVSGLDKGLYLHAVLGEDGVGTTTFVNYVKKHIQHSCSVGLIDQEIESSSTLLRFALESFGQQAKSMDVSEMVEQLCTVLKVEFEKNNQQSSILIIDDVHKMAAEAFQAIDLLATINYKNKKLIQLILVGNNQLREILQVISEKVEILWHHLNPLTAEETQNYIHHQLKIAGITDINLFNEQSCAAIYECSNGIPKAINSLCHRLLLFSSTHQIDNLSPAQILQFTDDERASANTLSPITDGTTTYSASGFFKEAWGSGLIVAGIGLAVGFILGPYLTGSKETQVVVSNKAAIKSGNDKQKWLDTLSGKTSGIEAKVFQEILTQEIKPLSRPDNRQQASIVTESSAKNRQVEKLLSVAEQQFLASKLLTPNQDNAYETYTAILAIIANEKRAISGLQQIADRYLTLATKSFNQGELLRGKTLTARGLRALPSHKQLIALSKQIDDFDLNIQQQNQQAEILLERGERQLATLKLITPEDNNAYQTYLKIFAIDKTNQQAKQGIREIQRLLSAQLQKALTKKQYDSAWALVEQISSVPDKEDHLQNALATANQTEKILKNKITNLFTRVEQQLESEQSIKPAGNNATETYRMILGIDRANSDAKQGLKNILTQHKIATKDAFEKGKTKQALIYANEAVAVFPDNVALLELQSKISFAKKRLRPFGNF